MFSHPILRVQTTAAFLLCHLLNCIHLLSRGPESESGYYLAAPRVKVQNTLLDRHTLHISVVLYSSEKCTIIHIHQQQSFSKSTIFVRFRFHWRSVGKKKKKKATLTIMAAAQSEVNYIDWCSDIKCIPFGSRLVMPSNVPFQQAYLWPLL